MYEQDGYVCSNSLHSNQKTDIIVMHAVIVMRVFMFASHDPFFLVTSCCYSCDSVQKMLFNCILQQVMSPVIQLTLPL